MQIHVAKYQECPAVTDFCDEEDQNGGGASMSPCNHASD